ncbi:hypothetical protein TB2_036078 [Malus domestica]
MATDFFWSYTDEPRASRRRQILSQYPQIKELLGPDPWAFLKNMVRIRFLICFYNWVQQVNFAEFCQYYCGCLCFSSGLQRLHNAGWLKMLGMAYFFGSFLNHTLFLAIHELSHNLAFSTPVYNCWLGICANLPIGVPVSAELIWTSQASHVVTNVVTKSIWLLLQLFFYALRPVFLKPKPPGYWEFLNLFIQIALDVAMVYFYGWKSFAYLILSTFVGGGMHPMAGHFISEHYVFNPDQETYSYYGPLNLLAWHVGYHNEHHDFPRIPGSKLHKVKDIAPEYYGGLVSYKSWSQVIYMYIADRTVGPFSRTKRKATKSE